MKRNVLVHDCVWFENMLANMGEKGFSIVALHEQERAFFLEARPFERGYPDESLARGATQSIGIAISMRLPMSFCPSCGRDLRALVQAHPAEFDKLAKEALKGTGR